ncbi:hypothetical protein ACFL20_00110 [Spirochaetota bacterium]
MNRCIKIIVLLLVLGITFSANLYGQEEQESKQLYYTYVGPVIGGGFNNIWYTDWFSESSSRQEKKLFGYYVSTGAMFNIFINFLVGDFRIQYLYSSNDDHTLHHLLFSMAGKYLYRINDIFSLTAGLGFYFESPPSNKDFNSAGGLHVPLGCVVDTTFDTKLVIDFICQFGYYGLGYKSGIASIGEKDQNSLKVSYGISVGFIFKVGRI